MAASLGLERPGRDASEVGASLAASPASSAALPASSAALPAASCAASLTRPPALKAGDLVAVVAPAGPVGEAALAAGLRVLENQGFRVRLGRNVTARRGYLAGEDEARAEDFNLALTDPDIRGIVCARGGYGAMRILPLLDYAAARADPKVIVGYSDVTALHAALAREAGLVTFHGPMVESLGRKLTRFTLECFFRAVTTTAPLDVLPLPAGCPPPTVMSPGRATGLLAGGNLSLVAALAGTSYEIDCRGRILLLEEVGERPYRVDRMLTQLALAGRLAQTSGIAVGGMIGCDPEPETPPEPDEEERAEAEETAATTVVEVLADRLARSGRPVVAGLPFGHGRDKWTVPLGVPATLDAYKGRLILEEAALTVRKESGTG